MYNEIIKSQKTYYAFKEIEAQRFRLLHSQQIILKTDLGNSSSQSYQISLQKLAQNSLMNRKEAQFLFRLMEWRQPETIIELGTSLGITTAYLAKACANARIETLEGCTQTTNEARNVFNKLQLKNIKFYNENIDTYFSVLLSRHQQLEVVIFDANHTYEATIKYFEMCKPKIYEDTILIWDDIYWSPEMTKAWNQIKEDPIVSITIDLYQIGIAFFRTGVEKQNFTLWS